MGYAEFGGTGSIRWEIGYANSNDSNLDKDDPPAAKMRGYGEDKDGGTSPGDILRIKCTDAKVLSDDGNGNVTVEVTLARKPRQVKLTWGKSVHESVLT